MIFILFMCKIGGFMGRHRKYINDEQQTAARKKRQMEYYWRNKESINLQDKEEYLKKKEKTGNDISEQQ